MKNVDPSDIVKVVQNYSGYIKKVCHKFFIVGGTKEDLFQEGVIGAIEACKNYNGESLFEDKFDPFVKLCIKRQIIDAIKKTQAKKNLALNSSVPIITFDESGEEISKLDTIIDRTNICDPLEIFIDREKFNEKLKICERELSEFEKIVLSHYLAGEKQSEIAKKLGKTVKSIDNTLQRIKTKVK